MILARILSRFYKRADRVLIGGMFKIILWSVFGFVVFKVLDYNVTAPMHQHDHFGLSCSYGFISWASQVMGFIGLGLLTYFIHLLRTGPKLVHSEVDLQNVEKLTSILQERDAQLLKERARFKQVVDTQMEYVNKHTPDGTLTFVNKALYEVMGFNTWEPLEGQSIYQYLDPDDAAHLKALHQTLDMRRNKFTFMHPMKVGNNKYRWVEWQNCGIFTPAGKLRKVLAVGRDVTDRYIMEAKLKESEAKYRNLFHNMISGFAIHIIVCRLNPDTGLEEPCDYHFIDVNPAFEHMFGFTREEIVGRTVLEVMPNTEPSLISRFGHVAATGKADRFRCRFVDINKWFDVTAFSNQPGQFAATFLDITEMTNRTNKRERCTDK